MTAKWGDKEILVLFRIKLALEGEEKKRTIKVDNKR